MSESITSVTPTVDATGIHVPEFSTLLAHLEARMRQIFGVDIYIDPDSQDGQVLGIVALAWADTMDMSVSVYNAFSPSTAQGTGLSSQVKINGIDRNVATRSTVDLLIVGVAGTTIVDGAAGDENGVRWNLPSPTVIPVAGEITVTATAADLGDQRAEEDTINRILTPTRGWQTVNNATAANPGAPIESDAALRIRQAISTALPSLTVLDGIIGAVATIDGVTRYRAYENDSLIVDANGIPAHAISLVVDGGDAQEIVDAIGLKKSPGVSTYGTTTGVYEDFYGIPHDINFYRPTEVAITVEITLTALDNYTSVIGDQMRQAVTDYINALRIGDTVYWSKVFVPANLANGQYSDTFDITEITLSRDGDPLTAADVVILFNEAATCDLADVSVVVSP